MIASLRAMGGEGLWTHPRGGTSESSFVVNTSPCFQDSLTSALSGLVTNDNSENLWAGKLQLTYNVSDDLMLYGGVNRGVKAGSYNAPCWALILALAGTQVCPMIRRS